MSSASTYDAYVKQRYKNLACIGKLYDFEFMVKEKRDDERGADRTVSSHATAP